MSTTGHDHTPFRLSAALLAVALVACVAVANIVTTYLGLVPAGFGLMVTAGTYAAGITFALRDNLHDAGGVRWVLGAIAGGVVVSLLFGDWQLAFASAAAFALAELLDLAVYAPLRRRNWRLAVVASNAIGAVVDTFVFLAIAPTAIVGPITAELVGGQLLVKAIWVTAGYLVLREAIRRAMPKAVAA